jgi:hypothetical protein
VASAVLSALRTPILRSESLPKGGWSECIGVWGKGQDRVGAAVHRRRQRLPFPLLGLDSDNGGEFINQHLYTYCRREGIILPHPEGARPLQEER